jgi:hypothetical protein
MKQRIRPPLTSRAWIELARRCVRRGLRITGRGSGPVGIEKMPTDDQKIRAVDVECRRTVKAGYLGRLWPVGIVGVFGLGAGSAVHVPSDHVEVSFADFEVFRVPEDGRGIRNCFVGSKWWGHVGNLFCTVNSS